ncbi:MAG: oxidoreductase [Turicibacter sp.]|nr:oxidoreductase [Turicibacter sp.]
MESLKIGYIGFGKSTKRYHLPYTLIRKNLEVKAIYNRSKKPAEELPYRERGIMFSYDLDEFLGDGDIQLVVIVTAAPTHFEFAKKAILAKKHVLVEKPFVETLEQAKELLALAKSNGVLVMPFQNRRFDGDFLAAKEVIERNYLGDLIEVETHYDYFRPSSQVNNGPLCDTFVYGHAVHLIDRMVYLFGRPQKVYYDVKNVRVGEGLDDYHDIHLFYRGFKVVVKSQHLVKTPYPQFLIHGKRGSFIKYGIDMQEADLKAGIMPGDAGFGEDNTFSYGQLDYLNQNGDTIKRELKTPLGDYGRLYDNFYEAIMNGAPKLITDEQILTVVEILERAYEAESPHIVTLS